MKTFEIIPENKDRTNYKVRADRFSADADFIWFFIGENCVAIFPTLSIFGITEVLIEEIKN